MNVENFFEDARYSRVPSLDPDPKEFPLYYKARKYEYLLNPGERLFIPTGWFHFVDSKELDATTGMNIAVNFWFNPGTREAVPKVKWHRLTPEDVFRELRKGEIKCLRSYNGIFPSTTVQHHFPDMKIKFENMSFDDFLELNNPQYYIAQNKLENSDLKIEENFDDSMSTNVWFNRGPCKTLMHYDGQDNWICQVIGKKRVILFAPSEHPNLYTYNPYPSHLLDQLRARVYNNSVFLNVDNQIPRDLVNRILSSLEDTVEKKTIINDQELQDVFKRVYMLYENHLQKSGCMIHPAVVPPSVNFQIFRTSCNSIPLRTSEFSYNFIFCLRNGNVSIGRYNLSVKQGDILACPATFEYPVTLSGSGVYILPTKENVTMVEDGPGV
jgi:hypothetical protein